jgi:anti-anti-sigma factor
MPTEFSITIIHRDGSAILRLTGELDSAAAPQLRAALDPVAGAVTFDLQRLSFVDAAGLRVIAETARTHGPPAIIDPNPWVRKILTICQMDTWVAKTACHDPGDSTAARSASQPLRHS